MAGKVMANSKQKGLMNFSNHEQGYWALYRRPNADDPYTWERVKMVFAGDRLTYQDHRQTTLTKARPTRKEIINAFK